MRIPFMKKTRKTMYTITPEIEHFRKNDASIAGFRTRVNYLLVNPTRVSYGNFKDPNFTPIRTILILILVFYTSTHFLVRNFQVKDICTRRRSPKDELEDEQLNTNAGWAPFSR
ncbi:hypothetical protein Hanom_Chr08g00683921 [Helianthus anomalus]